MIQCNRCGQLNQDNNYICCRCGQLLPHPNKSNQADTPIFNNKQSNSNYNDYVLNKDDNNSKNKTTNTIVKTHTKNNKTKKLDLKTMIIIGCAIIGLILIIIISNKANTKSIVNTESTVVDNSNQTETIEESNITEDINRYGNNKIGYITLNKNNWIENKIDDYTVQYTDNKMNITLSLIEQSKINCNELINKLTSVLNDSYKVSVRYESKDDCEIAITNISYSTEQLITIACIQYTNTNNINFIALESNQLQQDEFRDKSYEIINSYSIE